MTPSTSGRSTNNTNNNNASFWTILATTFLLITAGLMTSCAHAFVMDSSSSSSSVDDNKKRKDDDLLRLAFLGNSMLYFNDCPRLLEQMMMQDTSLLLIVKQDSCLRGGASLVSLWEKGNGMQTKFATNELQTSSSLHNNNNNKQDDDIGAPTVAALLSKTTANKNVVIMNDHTQSPARTDSRNATLQVLQEKYLPLLQNLQQQQNNSNSKQLKLLVIIIQTPAYRYPNMRGTVDLGDFDEYTDRLAEGCHEYATFLRGHAAIVDARVAPVGEAYRQLRLQNPHLWEKLYSWDHFHPSLHGTWLQACILYCMILTQEQQQQQSVTTAAEPPVYQEEWWDHCRYLQPPDQEPLPRPTMQEAEELRQLACRVCGVPYSSSRL